MDVRSPYRFNGYFYLASPFSDYPEGLEAAYKEICKQAALLKESGIPVFCPISHGWGIQKAAEKLPHTYGTWMNIDKHMLKNSKGVIVCKMDGWDQSKGVIFELGLATAYGKKIIYMMPDYPPPGLMP